MLIFYKTEKCKKKGCILKVGTNELVLVVKSGLFYYNERRTIVYGKKM